MEAVQKTAGNNDAGQQLPVEQPPASQSPKQEMMGERWRTDLFGCKSLGNCVLGCCIPCYLTGQASERMRDPTMRTAKPVNPDCMIHGALRCVGIGFLWVTFKRGEIRNQFDISGSFARDVITSYCCTCCSTVQQCNEVEARLGAGVIDSDPGYQRNEAMVVPTTEQAPSAEQNPASKETNSTQPAPA